MWQVHVLAAVLLAGRVLADAPAVYSELWGEEGELWDPAGPLPDFSFAGESHQLVVELIHLALVLS